LLAAGCASATLIILNLIKPFKNGEYIPLQDKSMQLNKANRIWGQINILEKPAILRGSDKTIRQWQYSEKIEVFDLDPQAWNLFKN